ncbi:MAG: nitroreductase/quinone reductase family protein [Acidimicrobiia bacterium]
MTGDIEPLDRHSVCHITTCGRVTGNPHRIEIWFAQANQTLYVLSGGGDVSDWVRNLIADPFVRIEVGDFSLGGVARVIHAETGEDRLARDLVFEKYRKGYGGDLSEWRESSLAIGIDLVTD